MKLFSKRMPGVAIVLACLITFVIGWKLAPQPSRASAAGEIDRPQARVTPRERPSQADTPVSRKMERIRNGASPVERSRAAISLAMTLSPSEFAAWVEGDRFSSRSGPELSIFRMILFERWIEEDPDGLIAWGIHNDYGQAGRALDHLAEHDPERVLAHFREHPNEAAELRQLKEIAKGHPSLALARLKELHEAGISSGLDRTSRELLEEISKGSIAELEAALVSLPDGMKEQAQSVIYGRKLEKDFPGEITKLMAHPEGMKIFRENLSLLRGKTEAILAAIPDMPDSWRYEIARSGWDFLNDGRGKKWIAADLEALGFSQKQAASIHRSALQSLLYREPAFVLNNIGDLSKDRWLLESSISYLMRASDGSEEGMAKTLAEISSPEIREAAREQWQAALSLKNAGAAGTASDWFQNLGGLEASSLVSRSVGAQLRNLDEGQLAEYRESFRGLSGDVKANAAISIAKSMQNSSDTGEIYGDALQYLAQNPPARGTEPNDGNNFELSKSASEYVVRLSMDDPTAAVGWLGSLPEGSTREWAAKNLAANWNQYDPVAVSRWMKTLPSNERALVQGHLDGKQ